MCEIIKIQITTMNKEIIDILEEFAQIANITGNEIKERAYKGAIMSIKQLDWSIKNNLDKFKSEKIPGVGKAIRKKIIEWVETGNVAELVTLMTSKEILAYKELSGIIGVGPATIKQWLGMGIYSLTDLRKSLAEGKIELNENQKYGLIYYHDLNQKIPREEVTELSGYVISMIKRVDPVCKTVVCGSYRRGASVSSDVDILVSNPTAYDSQFISKFVEYFCKDPCYITALSKGKEKTSILYCSKIVSPQPRQVTRQIDILNLPYDQFWPGVLYFTGSWDFNEAMRGWAKMKGFKLNQKGLFFNDKGVEKQQIVHSEEDIFKKLNLQFVAPEERIGKKLNILHN